MRPIGGAFYPSVFDRVVMDVIDVGGKIGIVADLVFPESSLPDTTFAADYSAAAWRRLGHPLCGLSIVVHTMLLDDECSSNHRLTAVRWYQALDGVRGLVFPMILCRGRVQVFGLLS